MKAILTIVFVGLLTGILPASWPYFEVQAGEFGTRLVDVEKAIRKHRKINISAPGYRRPTIEFDKQAAVYRCRIPVAYYHAEDWLKLTHTDTQTEGWTPRPESVDPAPSGECANLVDLIALLDRQKVQFKRHTAIRKETSTGKLLAVWNTLQFDLPEKGLNGLTTFLRVYFSGLDAEAQIDFYGG